ncbi:DUF3987 domain-containing protein [Prevotella sp.]|uniref:DUF3987 domain-containing protein n=1 Tax=Prevotella sp. TaxID=59823 RepID=UPI003AB96FE4
MSKLNLFDLNKYDDLKNDDNNNPVNHDVNSVNPIGNSVDNGEDGSKVSQPIDEGTDTVDCVSAGTVNCVSADDVAYALSDTRSDAVRIVNELAARHIDITETYKQWVSVAFALISEFGEQGREMFHMLSRQNSRYQYEESDRKFSSCLKSHGSGITIKTIFHLAKEAGVELANHENYLHEERRTGTTTPPTPPTPPSGGNNENIEKSTVLGCFNEFGGVAELAELADFPSEPHLSVTGYTFSDKLPLEDLPAFLAPIYEVHDNSVDRDKMLLGALNIISGLMGGANGTADCHCGIYGLYDARRVYAPLYNIVYGAAGSSKGEIAFCKRIAAPVKQEMRRQYEYEKQQYEQQMAQYEAQSKGKAKADRGEAPKEPPYRDPFVPGNSSSSAVYRAMDANGGWGMMFETEADTVSAMIASDYGNYSDLMRKAHHHEPISMNRVTDRIHIDIDEPKLSVFLTCTPGQLSALFTASSFENGLGSRILFYEMPEEKATFHDVFARKDEPLEETYRRMGDAFLPLYHELRERKNSPLQFVMSSAQQQQFLAAFGSMLHEQSGMLGSGITAFIYRLALEGFRYAMVLTALRRLSEWTAIPVTQKEGGIFRPDERALVCDDRDFRSAMTIVGSLVNHTTRVYAVLAKENDNPFAKIGVSLSAEEQRVYRSLPETEFKTSDFKAVAQRVDIPLRSAERMLSKFCNVYRIISPVRYGFYRKVMLRKDAS